MKNIIISNTLAALCAIYLSPLFFGMLWILAKSDELTASQYKSSDEESRYMLIDEVAFRNFYPTKGIYNSTVAFICFLIVLVALAKQ